MIQGAIFDVDGTLLDSMPLWGNAALEVFKNHGKPLTMEEAIEIRDIRLEDSIPMLVERKNINLTGEEVLKELKKIVIDGYKYTVQLKPYVKEYLSSLKADGVKIAVATSSYRELCDAAFSRLGISDMIDAYAFSHEVNTDKSNPDIYLLAAKRLGVQPSECIVFEDILHGITGAKKGGFMTCAIYDEASRDNIEIIKRNADKYITSWKELL